MTSRSKKIQEILFGNSNIVGGLPVVASLNYPQVIGFNKTVKWRGNEGLIVYLIERIEELEKKVTVLETNKK